MRRIFRSSFWRDPTERDDATKNLRKLQRDRLLNLTSPEQELTDHLIDFLNRTSESPQFQRVYDHFEVARSVEVLAILDETPTQTFYRGASFADELEEEVERQAADNLTALCKRVVQIATKGLTEKGVTIKGTDAAVASIFAEARGKPTSGLGRIPANMKKAQTSIKNLLQERKNSPQQTYGVLTGYGLFDQATAGIRRSQAYFHAGFKGHLKTTMMLNMIVNAAVDGGWNPLLFESEMPADDVKILITAIHSSNPRFAQAGRPISAFRAVLGNLTQQEQDFFDVVYDDLVSNPDHGTIRVIDTSEFTTFGSIMQRTVREHAEEEVDLIWVDYLARLPVDFKYQKMDIRAARNETIADFKRFAMSFDEGKGLPCCSPFQINREGWKRAKEHEGKVDMAGLSDYNAVEAEADVITYIFYDEEEASTSEPKVGLLKARWGKLTAKPVSLFIEPESRRIFDMSAGMGPSTGHAPTSGGMPSSDVEL